jgi:uncharacterized protein (TIGR03066 family)
MRSILCGVATVVIAGLTTDPSGAEDKKGPGTAEQLVGTWVVTKAPAGLGQIQKGSTLEFKKDGKVVIESKPGATPAEGTYTVAEGAVTIQDKAGKMTLPIKTLTGDKLALGGQDSIECAREKK